MRRAIVVALILGLLGGLLAAPADAGKRRKKKKPKIEQVDQTLFLRRDGCGTDNDNTRLSLEDGDDAGCWYVDAGVLYEAIAQADEAGAPFNSSVLWEHYPVDDGVPFTLDATKPITGEITLYGGSCIVSPACSPVGLSAGQSTFRVRFVGETGGEEKELGIYEDTFTTVPGETHTSEIELEVDQELNGAVFDLFRIEVFRGGLAYGPGGIEYDDPASFIVVPSLVTRK